jgi:AcrR family transcriptional regulator
VETVDTADTEGTAELVGRAASSERRRARVRREIARHAVDLCLRQGFQATTVEDIATAADYHASSFFRYFASKEEAVFVGLPELTEWFCHRCAEIQPDGDVWAQLREVCVGAIEEFARLDPGTAGDQFRLWTTDPALQAPLAEAFAAWERIVAGRIATMAGLTRPDLGAHLIGVAVVGAFRTAITMGISDPRTFAEHVDQAIRLLAGGLQVPPTQ